MRILEMVQQMAAQVPEIAGPDFLTPPGWAAARPAEADLAWRPAPDLRDGSLSLDPDFSLHSAAGPVAWQLFYSTDRSNVRTEWGFGWRASFPLGLSSDGTTVTVTHEDGADRPYQLISGSYVPQGTPTGDSLVKNVDGSWDETNGETGFQYHFPAGNMASIAYRATPQGLRLTYNYDANGRLESIVEPVGRRLTLTYTGFTGFWKVQSVRDWANRRNTLAYGTQQDLLTVQGPSACLTQYIYQTADHRVTKVTDPEGYQTSYTYDYAGRVLTRSVAGNLGRYTYQVSGSVVTSVYTDPMGKIWTHSSSGGYPTGQIDPLGNRQTYVYASGRPSAFTDALGHTTTFSFDARGFYVGTQDVLGYRLTYTRDANTNVITAAYDPFGNITTYVYGTGADARQLQQVIDPLGYVTSHTYYSNGLLQSTTDRMGATTTNTWTTTGLLQSQMDPMGFLWTNQYDTAGNLTVRICPKGPCWTYQFDPMGRISCETNPQGFCITTGYDARGKLETQVDPLSRTATFTWNSYGQKQSWRNPLGARWTFVFDAKGRLIATTDPTAVTVTTVYDNADRAIATIDMLGRISTSVYDGAGQLSVEVGPDGTRVTHSYDAIGHHIEAMENTGLRTTTLYDAAGRAYVAIDVLGLPTTTVYDPVGRVQAVVQPTGAITTTVYDPAGRVSAVVNAMGDRWTTTYWPTGQVKEQIDPLGSCWTTTYYDDGLLKEQIAPDGGTTTTLYDPSNRVWQVIDPLGYRTTTLYDQAAQVSKIIDAMGNQTTFAYNLAGQIIQTTDARHFTSQVVYELAGRVRAEVNALGYRTTTLYDATGVPTETVNALGYRTTTVYDFAGREQATIDATGARGTIIYDGHSRVSASIDPRGYSRTTLYDNFGRAATTQDPLGYLTTTLFDSFGRTRGAQDPAGYSTDTSFDFLDRPEARIDAMGYRTTTVYRATGDVEAIVDAMGRRSTTVYDRVGRAIAEINARGYRTTFGYNIRGDRTTLTNARGYLQVALYDGLSRAYASVDFLGRRTTLTFDEIGNPINQVDPKGQLETNTYNGIGRQTGIAYANGTRVTTTFDALDRMLTEANQNGTWTRSYDPVGNTLTENAPGHPHGHPLTNVYDLAGNRIGLLTWRGRQTWSYNARNETETLVDIEGETHTWTYDGRSLVSRLDYPNAAWMTATYDGNGRNLQIRHAYLAGGVTPTELTTVVTGYDAIGNVVNLSRPTLATYTYDIIGELLTESHSSRGLTTWSYDSVGNQVTILSSEDQTTLTATYDAADELINEANSFAYQDPSLPWFTSATFSYDSNGNRSLEQFGQRSDAGWSNTTTTYGWDPANRLLTVTHTFGMGTDQADSYRPDGLRAAKVEGANTQKIIWDQGDLLAQVDGNGNVLNFYSRGATLVKRRNPSGATYPQEYLHPDAQGTVIMRSGIAGAPTTGVLDPDPWGGHSGTDESVLGWLADSSYFFEPGLQRPLYYVRARWYLSGGPLWLSRDPLGFRGGQVTLYKYAENRPLTMADPTGLIPIPLPLAPACQYTNCPPNIKPAAEGLCALLAGPWSAETRALVSECVRRTSSVFKMRCGALTPARANCLTSICSPGGGFQIQCETGKSVRRQGDVCRTKNCALTNVPERFRKKFVDTSTPIAGSMILCVDRILHGGCKNFFDFTMSGFESTFLHEIMHACGIPHVNENEDQQERECNNAWSCCLYNALKKSDMSICWRNATLYTRPVHRHAK
jgi:RHS repeat-associated protein